MGRRRRPSGGRIGLRRLAMCVVGCVVSCYVLLFVAVVSRNLDANAEVELRRSAALVGGGGVWRRAPGGSTDGFGGVPVVGPALLLQRAAVVSGVQGAVGPSPLQLARLLDESGRTLLARRRTFRVCVQPRLRDPPGPLTALASFPGSGNTWLRYLVQQITGFLTGSVYRDLALMRYGFPGESLRNGSVVLVKTHEWGEKARKPFQKVVLLIRDPYGALLAEFNRRAGGHLGHAGPDRFQKGNNWQDYVTVQIGFWSDTILDWLRFERPLMLVRYEDLLTDTGRELRRLSAFLNTTEPSYPVMQCVLHHKEGIFRRNSTPIPFDPFTPQMHRLVDRHKQLVESAIQRRMQQAHNNETEL